MNPVIIKIINVITRHDWSGKGSPRDTSIVLEASLGGIMYVGIYALLFQLCICLHWRKYISQDSPSMYRLPW